ncbi:hypothetical protein EPN42_14880 [bacterium]|nr:MAG: hypothetical protein EPN42_14880 [bacterium]
MTASIKWWIAAAVFAAAFLFLSIQEGVYDFSVSLMPGHWHVFPRKVMATACFAILSFCVARAAERDRGRTGWVVPVSTGTIFSAVIEVAQHYYDRYLGVPIEPHIWNAIDVLTGTIGGLLAVWALSLTRRPGRSERRRQARPEP